MQERCNYSALAKKLYLFCTNITHRNVHSQKTANQTKGLSFGLHCTLCSQVLLQYKPIYHSVSHTAWHRPKVGHDLIQCSAVMMQSILRKILTRQPIACPNFESTHSDFGNTIVSTNYDSGNTFVSPNSDLIIHVPESWECCMEYHVILDHVIIAPIVKSLI